MKTAKYMGKLALLVLHGGMLLAINWNGKSLEEGK